MRLKITEKNEVFFVKFLKSSLSFGRSKKCDVRLDCPHISGMHCEILLNQESGVLLKDLESMNGSHINEILINEPTPVYLGDVIRIGNILIEIDQEKLSAREKLILTKPEALRS